MANSDNNEGNHESHVDTLPTCGVVMPIADFDPYPVGHWNDVYAVIEESISEAGYSVKMVSSEDAVGVIQQRIVRNLYDNDIVVVDVSGRNPNVMFELGMRLAFDKPVVIIKDELTPYNFDTSPIEHLGYRSDLHYQSIVNFKSVLGEKIRKTFEGSKKSGFVSFLNNFGKMTASKLEHRDGSEISVLLAEILEMRREIRSIRPKVGGGYSRGRSNIFSFSLPLSDRNLISVGESDPSSPLHGRGIRLRRDQNGYTVFVQDVREADFIMLQDSIKSSFPNAVFMPVVEG